MVIAFIDYQGGYIAIGAQAFSQMGSYLGSDNAPTTLLSLCPPLLFDRAGVIVSLTKVKEC